MLGAIIGDMVGSSYEFINSKVNKNFDIFNPENRMTDDSLLTIATAKVLLNNYPIKYDKKNLDKIKTELIENYINEVRKNPLVGWGQTFMFWANGLINKTYGPYNSFGNGSAMRVSPVGWFANTINEVKLLSKTVSEITHNHPEGIKGAESIAMCVFLARKGKSKDEIKNYVAKNYYPEILKFNYDNLVKNYVFDVTCQGSCPQAIFAFLISKDFEDTIRNCVSIGGDCDTTGAMAGAIAEAFYSRDKLSAFENKFVYLFLDHKTVNLLKKVYNTFDIHKFDNCR